MNRHEPDVDENDLLESYERDEWHSIPNVQEEIQRYRSYAIATVGESRFVRIGLSTEHFQQIERKANEQGLPFDALVTEILRQFASGRLVQQP